MKKNSHLIFVLFLIIFCSLLYGYGMGSVGLSDPDETFYAETAKEMLNYRSFITPLIFGKPQFEKPPMFYWLIILASLFKGISEFSVRLIPAAFGTLGVIAIYFLGNVLFNRKTAIYASLILATNFLYMGLSRCALTDIVFSVFVLLSLLFFYAGYKNKEKRRLNLCLFFLFSGLAVLTKGPLGILIPILTIFPFLCYCRDLKFLKREVPWIWGGLIFLIVAVPWYAAASLKHTEFLKSFFVRENIDRFFIAEHKSSNHWYFYPAVLLGSSFPWSILFPMIFITPELRHKKEMLFLKCWFWFPLIFFTAAQSKLASYILPVYPALCLILASSISRLDDSLIPAVRLKIAKAFSTLLVLFFLTAFVVSLFFLKELFPAFFSIYLPMVIIVVLGLLSVVVCLWKDKYRSAVIIKSATVFVFITILMSNIGIAEEAFSDKALPKIIRENTTDINEEVLCSKLYVRGVYFYTEKDVVVINDSKRAFFRPHPIKVLSEDAELNDIFKVNKDILCVVNKEHLERIKLLTSQRVNKVISGNFDRFVVISSPTSDK